MHEWNEKVGYIKVSDTQCQWLVQQTDAINTFAHTGGTGTWYSKLLFRSV